MTAKETSGLMVDMQFRRRVKACIKKLANSILNREKRMPVRRLLRSRPISPEALERREKIGELLQTSDLSLAAIARRVGVSRERVRQIQQWHFPGYKRPRGWRNGPEA